MEESRRGGGGGGRAIYKRDGKGDMNFLSGRARASEATRYSRAFRGERALFRGRGSRRRKFALQRRKSARTQAAAIALINGLSLGESGGQKFLAPVRQ